VVPAHWKCGPLGSTTGGWAKRESGAGVQRQLKLSDDDN
jgi:hypothetical protein